MRACLLASLLACSALAQTGDVQWKKSFVLSRAGDAWEHGRFDEAAKLYRTVLSMDAADEESLLHLAVFARNSKHLDEAQALLARGVAAHPTDARLQFELGVTLLLRGQAALAVTPLQAAVTAAPSLDGWVNLGDAQSLAGHRADAAESYRRALVLAPQSAWAHRQAGYNAWELGRGSEALAHLEAAAPNFPDEWQVPLTMGHAQAQLGNDAAALESYLKASRLAPQSEVGNFFVGTTLARLGRTDEAKKALGQAIARKPGWVAAHVHLGILLAHEGHRAEARGEFAQALKLDAKSAWALVQLGVLELEAGNPAKAKGLLSRAVALAPGDLDVVVALGDALQAVGQPQQAAQRYAEVLRKNPSHLGALVKSGDALRAQGKLQEAYDFYARAVSSHPTSAWAHITRGDALRGLKRLAEAKADFVAALELDPRSRWAARELGYTLFDLGEDDAARAALEPLSSGASEADVPLTLGHLALRRRAVEEAVTWYERARAADPKRARIWLALARALDQSSRSPEALPALDQALVLDDTLADAWILEGDMVRRSGIDESVGRARSAYRHALELDPNSNWARRQLGTLEFSAGDFGAAKPMLEAALVAFPKDLELWLLLGHVATAQHESALARERYLEATTLAVGDDVRPYVFAGKALLEVPKYDEADALFLKAIELRPSSAWAHLERGFGQRARRDWKAALLSAQQATSLEPKNAEAWLFLGRLRQETGAGEAAIEAYEAALNLAPRSLTGQRALASALANRRPARSQDLLLAEALLEEPLEKLASQGYTHAVAAWVRVQLWKLSEFALPAPAAPDTRDARRLRWAELARFSFKRAVELSPEDAHLRLAAAVGLFELNADADSSQMLAPLLQEEPKCPKEEWNWKWDATGEPTPPAPATTPEQVMSLDEAQLKAESWLLSSALLARDEPARSRLAAFCALTFMPWRADAHLRLGASYESVGLLRLAEEHFAVALRIDPTSVEARRSLERLRKEGGVLVGPVRVSGDTSFVSERVPPEVLQRTAQVLAFTSNDLQRTLLTTPRTLAVGADVSWEHPDWKGGLRLGLGYHFAYGFNSFLNDQLSFEDRRSHLVDLKAGGRFARFENRRYELTWQGAYRLNVSNATTRDEVRQQFSLRGRLLNVDLGTLEADLAYELGLFAPHTNAAIRDTTAHGLNFGVRASPLFRRWAVELGLSYRLQLAVLVPSTRTLALHELIFDGRKTWEHLFLGGDARFGVTTDAELARVASGLSIGFTGEFGYAWNGYSRASGRAGVLVAPVGLFSAVVAGLRGEHRFVLQGLGGEDHGLRVSAGWDVRYSWALGDVQQLVTVEVSLGR